MIYALLAFLPWVALGILMARFIRDPVPLPEGSEAAASRSRVSVIVPARNEIRNLRRCLESLLRLRGVPFEVIVVDDRSTDGTAELARRIANQARRDGASPGASPPVTVIDGTPLPEGWFGKPWACRQGADAASGDRLLFTDADTEHHPDLLTRTLAAMEEDRAEALSLLGRQELGSLAERTVQPQIFLLIGFRFRTLDRVMTPERWQDAIANGQFVLVDREAYESIGGHRAVKGEVVEDLRLAQELVRTGFRLTLRRADDVFSTRMYTSLRELMDGWTKNVAVGIRQSAPRWGRWALPGVIGFVVAAWIVPPALALASATAILSGHASPSHPLVLWSGATVATSLLLWAGVYHRFGVSAGYALLYPAGAVVTAFILLRSGCRGSGRIEWKGRRYGAGGGVTESSR